MNKLSSAVCLSDICMAPLTKLVCSSNFWQCFIVDVSYLPTKSQPSLTTMFLAGLDTKSQWASRVHWKPELVRLAWTSSSYIHIFPANLSSNALVISDSSMLDHISCARHTSYRVSVHGKLSIIFTVTDTNHRNFHASSVGDSSNTDPYTVIHCSDAHHYAPTIG
ncbi:hypothetical protein BDR06DRAFT_191439 [Suillus hirtellus]|nr:hypothetical protein BDR06DRAFT_191439 [Suillus hirtellus]